MSEQPSAAAPCGFSSRARSSAEAPYAHGSSSQGRTFATPFASSSVATVSGARDTNFILLALRSASSLATSRASVMRASTEHVPPQAMACVLGATALRKHTGPEGHGEGTGEGVDVAHGGKLAHGPDG